MFELIISGHYPNINEENIPRNDTIKIYFNKELDIGSIKSNSIIITDYIYKPVKGIINWDTTVNNGKNLINVLTFKPEQYLDPETFYYVTITQYPDGVKGLDDSFIKETYKFRFRTGVEIIDDQSTYYDQLMLDLKSAMERNDWCEVARISELLEKYDCDDKDNCGIEPDFPGLPDLPESGIIDPCFNLIEYKPENNSSDIPVNQLRFIKLKFDSILVNEGVDYSYYLDIIQTSVLE